ncbi:MAG: SDR family NAD(P)-dependent oxidoreductase [Streptomyces sp.]|uniref:SDR family NAD(P)-dependent oxidoreductase n=1 Tax=Streptomyces sp. TaxID=1931 RepID=UPI003D6A9955
MIETAHESSAPWFVFGHDQFQGHVAVVTRAASRGGHAFAALEARIARVDHVAHCAAVITSTPTPTLDADAAHWRRVLDNLIRAFLVAQESLRRMAEVQRGTMALVASDAGYRDGGGLIADAPYAASNAGVLSLVKSLVREFEGSGARVNALVPGPTDTPMHEGIAHRMKERIAAGIPLGCMGRPEDMAAAIVFLSSAAGSFIHGAAPHVDGGAMLR